MPFRPSLASYIAPDKTSAQYGSYTKQVQHLGGHLGWYAWFTRPDISATLGFCMQYVHAADFTLYEHLLYCLFYLKHTARWKIRYGKTSSLKFRRFIASHMDEVDLLSDMAVVFMADASHGPRPMQCSMVFAYGGIIGWRMIRGTTTPLSITEGEWFGQTLSTVFACSYDPIFTFLGVAVERPYILLCDNDAAVKLSDKNLTSRKLRHVATRLSFMQERKSSGLIALHHIPEKPMFRAFAAFVVIWRCRL